MKFYKASWETIITRYYLMMATVLISFFVGYPALSLFAVVLFLSALMGVSLKGTIKKITAKNLTYKGNRKEASDLKKAA